MIYELVQKAKMNGLLHDAGWSRKFLDIYMSDYKWLGVFTREEYDMLKAFQTDMNTALNGIDKAREDRYRTGTATREDIVRLLDKNIYNKAQQWGDDYIYTKWARDHKTKALDAYDRNLDPVQVAIIDRHYEDGYDYEDWLYTDGSVKTFMYGAY